MALIVEDGSGKTDAQTYVSFADVVAYGQLYGLSTAHVSEATIMRCMRYLEGAYYERWIGYKRTQDQALSWPRGYAVRRDGYEVPSDEVPQEIKDAVCALAVRATSGINLSPDITRGDVAIEEEVGPIRVKYASNAPTITIFRDIELILRSVLCSNGSSARIYRS